MLDDFMCNESVENSYGYFGYTSEDEVEWYFCEQNNIEVECYED